MSNRQAALARTDAIPAESVPARFRSQVEARGDAPAVVAPGCTLSYRQLDARARAFTRELIEAGVEPGDRVGVCMGRTVDLIVSLIAILEAGASYVPLEPGYPAARLSLMLDDCRPTLVLVAPEFADRLPAGDTPIRVVDGIGDSDTPAPQPARPEIDPERCAYIMYTSGSTGVPKGVAVPHRAIDRLVHEVDFVALGPDETVLHAAPIAFDASTFEVWGPLLTGGRLVLHPEPVPTAAGLRAVINEHGVTTAWLTAGLFNAVIDEDPRALTGLRQLLTGGEALSVPHVRRALDALPETQIINGYGPTETTTFALCNRIARPLPDSAHSIPIGRAIRHTELLILDDDRSPVTDGEEGELFIAGRGVALGYVDRPEQTAERFLPHPERPAERMYRTGDRVRLDPDGLVEFLGRADRQIKLRGFRIELGEIEVALMDLDEVRSAVVVAATRGTAGGEGAGEGAVDGERRLVAYVVLDDAQGDGLEEPSVSSLRERLGSTLPDHMVPAAFVFLPSIPLNANGKVDRAALPEPSRTRPDLATDYVAPRNEVERRLCALWAEMLGWDDVGIFDNLFDLGATSLLVVRTVARMRDELDVALPATAVFEHTDVAAQARMVSERGQTADTRSVSVVRSIEHGAGATMNGHADRSENIAIVGMAGRFPGAADVDTFWQNLCDGLESISTFAAGELDPSIPADLADAPGYVRARGILDDVDLFDAAFFGIAPREAALTDPQQRVLLEIAWETLEHAGHDPERFDGTIGVFAGKYNDTYHARNVATRPDLIAQLGEFQTMVANEKDYVATRLAHKLNLTGPAISVHTACSTSLVATAQAVRSLQLGGCDMALAGGVSITVPVRSGHVHQEGAMLSADGHTRTFDASAGGTVFSDGAAMVLLKRLSDARADGDTIHGVIRGCAVNNDGGNKASFTAPSVTGQATVIERALADAGVGAGEISFVEAHGTATPLGDPIEIEALTRAFRATTDEVGSCAIGSLKSNVGHLVIAAGAAGLIKTARSLRERRLPPSLHVTEPNPAIDFARSPFFVNTALRRLEGDGPLLAGVSSFGVGGTNAHVVVEEPPAEPPAGEARTRQVLMVSARSEAELEQARLRLADRLEAAPEVGLADVAFTLHAGRRAFPYRSAVTASDTAEAAGALRGLDRVPTAHKASGAEPTVAFLFPGQGTQFPGMGEALYRSHEGFRANVDEVCDHLIPELGLDLRDLLFPEPGTAEAAAAELIETMFAQTSLFVIEHALARLWLDLGIEPHTMVGHSVGEFVCATLAGVMDLGDAASLVAARGAIMATMPPGSMLSVRSAAADIEPLLGPDLEIAADNSPRLSVVSGPTGAVDAFAATLDSRGIDHRPLRTSHAFHSAMMEPAVEAFRARVEQVSLRAPDRGFVSSATGAPIRDEQATDPGYWADHLRNRVRFSESVRHLLDDGTSVLLEVGPRSTLTALAGQQLTDRKTQRCLSTMGDPERDSFDSFLDTAGRLWAVGVGLDPAGLHGPGPRRRVPLPTYPFARKRFWVDPVTTSSRPVDAPRADSIAGHPPENAMPTPSQPVLERVKTIIEECSGLELEPGEETIPFVELGLDSLLMTQLALAVDREFGVVVTFRRLIEALPDAATLADHIAGELPADAVATAPSIAPAVAPTAAAPIAVVPPEAGVPAPGIGQPGVAAAPGSIEALLQQQLALISQMITQQMALLGLSAPAAARPPAAPAEATVEDRAMVEDRATVEDRANVEPVGDDAKKPFGAIARINKVNDDTLTPRQTAKLDAFVRRYNDKTRRSKDFTQEHREVIADPRVVTGFRPAIKELVYPIVVDRSSGPRLWDLDGNEYIDTLNGFGLSLFGWQPDFVTKAVEAQLHQGHEIGPQSPLQADVARLICEFTGFDRAAFCNTGSEAVMGCARIARTVTGRSKIAIFSGAYHGIFDEVVVRGTAKLRSIPAAPGIMPSAASNVVVLEYGTPETLRILTEQADELAAIIVEPVQSRRPDFQPREFLHQLRELTEQHGIVYVFDEVVTGFRTGPGGAQEFFDVQADLGAYGKVVGGGLPIGVIAGRRPFMDALDGGHWQFGDDSAPPVGVTYFAGTFVRHPLALAAARAVLTHLKEEGPELQRTLNDRTKAFADDLNGFLDEAGVPMHVTHFASLWRANYTEAPAFGDLLFYMMRDRGIHIYDGFPCFFTTAHGEREVDAITRAFKESVIEMQEAGFLPGEPKPSAALDASRPPADGARLGRDPNGNPAWYVPNPERPGDFMILDDPSAT